MVSSLFRDFRTSVVALVLLALLNLSVAVAEDEGADPPGRVARLSYTSGAVSLQPAGVQDWADATVNRPLTTGDKLWADQNSKAELDIGSAVVRLGSMTGLSFLNLDDRTAQLNVTAGTAIVHVRNLGGGQSFEIDTPNVAVTVRSPGDYRVEVNEAGDGTVVKISNGEAEVSASGQSVPMHTQQGYAFNGTDQVSVDSVSVGAPDALDSWSLERERRSEEASARTQEYVPPDVTGADDLAEYGTWETTPDYGPVWTPTVVVAGWSPYHFGHWVWVAPWGWTWVDDAPWGFAPFHYGRWAYVGTRWCWVPGPRYVRPVYAPALVAWVGSPGTSVSITVGGGAAVGWFPLGPREVYVPSYRVSRDYVRNVNITNTTIVNNTYISNVYENKVTNITYVNRTRPGAVVAVSQDDFRSARPVSGHAIRIPPDQLGRFGARGAGPAIVPERESVLGRRPVAAAVRTPPIAFANRPVVARTAPPPAPVPFERQQAAIRANGGRPLGRAQITALEPAAAPNPRVRILGPQSVRPVPGGPVQGGAAGSAQPGQRFGTDRPGREDRPSAAPAGQQFGTARPGQPRSDQAPAGQQPGSIQERERALHATPIPPSPRANTLQTAPNQPSPSSTEPNQRERIGPENREPGFRNDRPPSARPVPQEHPTPEARPIPEARPVPEARPMPQARPVEPQGRGLEQRAAEQERAMDQQRSMQQQRAVEQQRAIEQQRAMEQQRAAEQQQRAQQQQAMEQQRALQQQRAMEQQERAMEQQRAMPQARPIEPARPEARAPEARASEQPRVIQRPAESPRPPQAGQPQRPEPNRGRNPDRN